MFINKIDLLIIIIVLIMTRSILKTTDLERQNEVNSYLENSITFCRIPDIDNGFIPQGISCDPNKNLILLTGYFSSRNSSPIYIIDRQSGNSKKILMNTEDGESFRGHAGGISLYQGYEYVAGSTQCCVYGFPLDTLIKAEDNSVQKIAMTIDLKNGEEYIRSSFTASDNTMLYVGEFHGWPFFCTHSSHAVNTPDGRQQAYLLGFTLDNQNNAIPQIVYSIPDKIQGACFDAGYLYLSQTDKLFSSRILTYDLSKITSADTKMVLGAQIPLYILCESCAVKSTRIPAMSEGILSVDGKLLILYESASNRYRVGKRLGLDYVLATSIDFFR